MPPSGRTRRLRAKAKASPLTSAPVEAPPGEAFNAEEAHAWLAQRFIEVLLTIDAQQRGTAEEQEEAVVIAGDSEDILTRAAVAGEHQARVRQQRSAREARARRTGTQRSPKDSDEEILAVGIRIAALERRIEATGHRCPAGHTLLVNIGRAPTPELPQAPRCEGCGDLGWGRTIALCIPCRFLLCDTRIGSSTCEEVSAKLLVQGSPRGDERLQPF